MSKIDILDKHYNTSFTGILDLYRKAKQEDNAITILDVKNYLKGQKSYTLHKITRKNFLRRKIIAPKPRVILSTDLMDMRKLAKHNNNNNYVLVAIDVFSRYAKALPIKSKTSDSMVNALKLILEGDSNFKGVSRINSDEGKEYYNSKVNTYLKNKSITLYSVSSREIKASIAERFIRTLKGRIYRYMTQNNTLTYINALPDLVNDYNNTVHSTLNETPDYVHKLTSKIKLEMLFKKMYIRESPKRDNVSSQLEVGESVRLADEYRNSRFRKGYQIQNTYEIFKIATIDKSQIPSVYYLEDLAGEPVLGLFYRDELIPTNLPATFDITVLKTKTVGRKKKYLVNWIGYPAKFDSWIDEEDIV